MRCNNCTAEYPSAGLAGIGARFRSFLIACGLVMISAGILRDCVLNHLLVTSNRDEPARNEVAIKG